LEPKLYILEDQYHSKLLGKAELTLKFHQCYRIQMEVGKEQLVTLDFKPIITTEGFVYSKCPKLVSFVERHGMGPKSVASTSS